MTHISPDPDPANTPGLDAGGGVPPGETPPGESSMPEAGPRDMAYNPPTGWAKGPLVLIFLIVLLVVVGLGAMAVHVVL
ncbi:DUF6480 family protein [Streptomyces sp. TRM64462]|uniref:DUF6480 family protein n=1 Tax=Streptomyces sp. TRM64462 TaxID=2741726 RepID=UPI001585E4D7|nr:DUF6480 family protein [Streptomyces sp. TRM64462]